LLASDNGGENAERLHGIFDTESTKNRNSIIFALRPSAQRQFRP
jgi:hypothetical protein